MRRTSRREFLGAVAATAVIGACDGAAVNPSPPSSATPTASPAPSSTPTPTASPAGPRPIVLRAGALADGRSSSLLRDVDVILRGDRIVYAGRRDAAPSIGDAEVLDAPALTVIPAMVDCHIHVTGAGGSDAHAALQQPDGVLLDRALANARVIVASGVLGVRDVGAVRAANVRARDAYRARAEMPYIVAAGTWIARRGRYVPFAVQVDDADQLLAAALAQLDAGADLVKIASDAGTGSGAHWSASELKRTVDAVHARGKTVAAHSQGLGARVAAEAGADTIEHGFVIDASTAAAMRGRATLVTSLSVARAFGDFELAGRSIRAARDAGVRIATGSDAGGGPPRVGDFAAEVELLVQAGLSPQEALTSATRIGGEVLGVAGLGTLDAGAPADFALVDGDPLSDPRALRNVRTVFRAGRRIT